MSTAAKKRAKTSKKIAIDLTTMDIPTGKFKGALPDNILINGERWFCIKTGDLKGRTYDKIENVLTGERKVYERQVLLEFLRKNWKKTSNKKLSIHTTVVHCDNIEAQKSVIFPSVNF
jgi:hypothetical protein